MRANLFGWMAAAVASVSGCVMVPADSCKNAQNTQPMQMNTVTAGDLTATIQINKRLLRAGEYLNVSLSIRDSGLDPIPIEAESLAPVIVTVWRYSPNGWQRVAEYPQTAIRQRTTRILLPGQAEAYQVAIPVEKTWPQNEVLKVTAELNGRPEARPFVFVEMSP